MYSDPNTLRCFTWHCHNENRPCAATDVQCVLAVLQLMYILCQLYCNWCTVCVTCTATDVQFVSAVLQLMYSLCQLYSNWTGTVTDPAACQSVLCKTQVTNRNVCIWRGYVLCSTGHSDLGTSRLCVLLDGKRQLHISVINGSHQNVKEVKEAIFTSAVCSLRPQTVYFCSIVCCTVWDIRLQIAAVNVAFLPSFINSLMVALFSGRNM